jgi:hypothetical protein
VTGLEERRRHRLGLLVGTSLLALLAHPLGALLSDLFWGTARMHQLTKNGVADALHWYAMATCFVAPPVIVYALIAFRVYRAGRPRPSLDAALRTGDLAFPLLALASEVITWKELGNDSQAGLLFIFLPLFAAAAASVLVAAVFVGTWVFNASRLRAGYR